MKSLILAVAVAAIVVPTAQARLDSERSQVTQSPASKLSPQEFTALVQRSVALNQKYGQAEAQSAYRPAIRALMLRSYAMNAWYSKHPSTPVIPARASASRVFRVNSSKRSRFANSSSWP